MHNLMRGAPAMALTDEEPAAAAPAVLSPLREFAVQGLKCVHAGGGGVQEASFVLRCGSVTAVVGRTGAGKTTLLRATLGLLPRNRGEVFWNGVALADPAHLLVPPRVAYVPQVPTLFSGTLADNVRLGWPADLAALERAAEDAALLGDVQMLPCGWRTQIGPHGVCLSGGQAQRVAIARALLRDPDLLVLDDVTSALDGETEQRLLKTLLARGKTLLAATGGGPLLAQANQVLWLEGGALWPPRTESGRKGRWRPRNGGDRRGGAS